MKQTIDKVVIAGGSYNAEVWGRSPQPPKDTKAIFTAFFIKYAFLSIFWCKFLLKRVLNDCKKSAYAPLRPAPWGACSPSPLLRHCW